MRDYHFFSDHKISEKGQNVVINGSEANHIIKVKRVQKGQTLTLIDNEGGFAKAVLTDFRNEKAFLEILDIIPSFDDRQEIILIISLLKGEAMDWCIQKATELGVKEIYPVITDFSTIKLDAEKNTKKIQRFKEISIQALKQCRSFRAPDIKDILPLENFLKIIKNKEDSCSKIWLWEQKKEQSDILTIFKNFKFSLPVCLLIGPEGGFSPREIKMIPEHGFIPATLGNRILRAETAALSSISIISGFLNHVACKNN
jgi:16S rRNA (uracil1498-N3)-methyltransferase